MSEDTAHPAAGDGTIEAMTVLLGERLNLRGIEKKRVASNPLVVEIDEGYAVLLRYGAAVFFCVDPARRQAFIEEVLQPHILAPYQEPETESIAIRVMPGAEEGVNDAEELVVRELESSRMQVVAEVLGKSAVLAAYEERLSRAFDIVEPLARELRQNGRVRRGARELLRYIGATLSIEQQMVGRAEVGERPEVLWERPKREKLYLRLVEEFEIRDRQVAVDRKVSLISTTTRTMLEVLQTSRSIRLEWYIVILIVVEILLTLYSLFIKAPAVVPH
jgi:uncharacterized Rmd1/YagE family protein